MAQMDEYSYMNEYDDQDYNSDDTSYEVVLELKQEIDKRDTEISCLESRLSTARDLIKQLEHELMNAHDEMMYASTSSSSTTSGTKKSKRSMSDDARAKWEFYHKHKNDESIVSPLLQKCEVLGLSRVPWTLIKKETDALYLQSIVVT